MDLKPGSRWKSCVCDTEVVVVRGPRSEANLECGGHPMIPISAIRPQGVEILPERAGGSTVGKRYADGAGGLEVLCSKAGAGTLALNGEPITQKDAKKLPSSD